MTGFPSVSLTHFKPSLWQLMYLSVFTFTETWSVDGEPRGHVTVIRIEAYFRNALPPGEWHSTDKCTRPPTFVVARSQGAAAKRHEDPYAHVTHPAFDGN